MLPIKTLEDAPLPGEQSPSWRRDPSLDVGEQPAATFLQDPDFRKDPFRNKSVYFFLKCFYIHRANNTSWRQLPLPSFPSWAIGSPCLFLLHRAHFKHPQRLQTSSRRRLLAFPSITSTRSRSRHGARSAAELFRGQRGAPGAADRGRRLPPGAAADEGETRS